MAPSPEFHPAIPNKIVATVKEVGQAQVARHLGDDYSPATECDWRVLDGYYHENAYYVAETLFERGYTPYLVWGAVRCMDDYSLMINRIEQLERTSRVHFWVELDPDDVEAAERSPREITTPVIIDLCSNAIGHADCPYVSLNRPERYQRMGKDPSYIRFERSFGPSDLISETRYRLLRQRSPELFSSNPWGTEADDARHGSTRQTRETDAVPTQ
jgi:hypothetical protein